MPVTGRDIVSGFVNRPLSFYGLESEVDSLLSGRANMEMSTKSTRQAFLDIGDDIELGSNGLAVAPVALGRRPHAPRRQLAPAL